MDNRYMQIIKKVFRRVTWPFAVFAKLIMRNSSYLRTNGWIESLKRGYPCRKDGTEIPWMNYPVVRFLEDRLKSDFDLFEFGSGYSTFFYAKLVNKVVSIEDDKLWFHSLKENIPENVEVIYKEKDIDGEYCRAIHSAKQTYDVVIVDGGDRLNCIKQSFAALSNRGVIILDDSQRESYSENINYAKEKGFRSIDFEGLKPTGSKIYRTTIFYRNGNCLDI